MSQIHLGIFLYGAGVFCYTYTGGATTSSDFFAKAFLYGGRRNTIEAEVYSNFDRISVHPVKCGTP